MAGRRLALVLPDPGVDEQVVERLLRRESHRSRLLARHGGPERFGGGERRLPVRASGFQAPLIQGKAREPLFGAGRERHASGGSHRERRFERAPRGGERIQAPVDFPQAALCRRLSHRISPRSHDAQSRREELQGGREVSFLAKDVSDSQRGLGLERRIAELPPGAERVAIGRPRPPEVSQAEKSRPDPRQGARDLRIVIAALAIAQSEPRRPVLGQGELVLAQVDVRIADEQPGQRRGVDLTRQAAQNTIDLEGLVKAIESLLWIPGCDQHAPERHEEVSLLVASTAREMERQALLVVRPGLREPAQFRISLSEVV